jgi:hypothetical protein
MKGFLFALIVFSVLRSDSCNQDNKVAAHPNKNMGSANSALSPQISSPLPEKYKSILDAKDWQNPYLVVQVDNVSLTANAASIKNKIIPTEELRSTLVSLPVSAWPYGKIIAAQQSGTIDSTNEVSRIKQNKERVESILKSLGLKVDWWPSA